MRSDENCVRVDFVGEALDGRRRFAFHNVDVRALRGQTRIAQRGRQRLERILFV